MREGSSSTAASLPLALLLFDSSRFSSDKTAVPLVLVMLVVGLFAALFTPAVVFAASAVIGVDPRSEVAFACMGARTRGSGRTMVGFCCHGA